MVTVLAKVDPDMSTSNRGRIDNLRGSYGLIIFEEMIKFEIL